MVRNLVEKGPQAAPLLIFNRTTKRSEGFKATLPAGTVEIASSLVDGIAAADIIMTCLADDDAVESALKAAVNANLPNISSKLFVDCSTIHPDTTNRLSDLITKAGASFVAVPVFGPPAAADAGALIAVLAGPSAAIDTARPFFKGVTCNREMLMRDEPCGRATLLKVVGNTFVLNMVTQLSEAQVLAEKSGLGTEHLKQLVDMIFGPVYSSYCDRMTSGEYWKREEPLFGVDLARKDARHALEIAGRAGVQMRGVENGDGYLKVVQEVKGAKGDIAGIYGAVRQGSGLEYDNNPE